MTSIASHSNSTLTLEYVESCLGWSAEAEAELTSRPIQDVLEERSNWLKSPRLPSILHKRWKLLNAVTVTAFCRLTGCSPKVVKKILRQDPAAAVVCPVDCRRYVRLGFLLEHGFTFSEVQRARKGEHVWMTKVML